MEGLVASVLLIAILLSVLLVVGGIVYLLAQRLPKRSREPPRKPANRWLVIGYIGTGQLGNDEPIRCLRSAIIRSPTMRSLQCSSP